MPLNVGPFVLTAAPDDDMILPSELEEYWGVDRSTGDALFVIRETPYPGTDPALVWSAHLWRGWEDGNSAPRTLGDPPAYATITEACGAVLTLLSRGASR